MASCLDHMFIPVIHGGLSTLLGLIMLAFTQFDFIFKYFFVVMTALVLIGLFNGIAMLPVMLSLFGPPCEVRSTVVPRFSLGSPRRWVQPFGLSPAVEQEEAVAENGVCGKQPE